MKKKLLSGMAFFCVAVVALATYTATQSPMGLTPAQLKNLEALTQGEWGSTTNPNISAGHKMTDCYKPHPTIQGYMVKPGQKCEPSTYPWDECDRSKAYGCK